MNRRLTPIILALFLVVGACASPPTPKPVETKPDAPGLKLPIVRSTIPGEADAGNLYRQAEKLYSERFFERAAQSYLTFIAKSRPDNRLIDNAYFKTGLSWFEIGRYKEALHYFTAVLERYKTSETILESKINAAICHFYLLEYAQAEKLFEEALEEIASPGHKAYIHYYRAQIAEKSSDFTKAVSLYIKSEIIAENERLISSAKERTERILHNFFGEGALLLITKEYAGRWPAKSAFNELLNIYRRSGDSSSMEKARREYRLQFPPEEGQRGPAYGVDDSHVPDNPKIGVALPITGNGADAGREVLQGINIAFSAFHTLLTEKGIKIIIKDTASEPAKALTAMELLSEDQDTLAIIGPVFSDAFERASEVSGRYLVPIFSPSATEEGLASRGERLFRNSLTAGLETSKLARLATATLGISSFAVLYPNNTKGEETFTLFMKSVEEMGGEVVAAESYSENQNDFSKQIRQIGGRSDDELRETVLKLSKVKPGSDIEELNRIMLNANESELSRPVILSAGEGTLTNKNFRPGLITVYDAVYVIGPADKTGLIFGQLAFYNIKNVTRLAGSSANSDMFLTTAEQYADGVIFVDGFFKDSSSTAVRSFTRKYSLAFREKPTAVAAQAYDAAMIILSGIAHGANSRKSMTEYLHNLSFFEGVSGVTSINQDGDSDKKLTHLTVSEGKIIEFDSEAAQTETEDVKQSVPGESTPAVSPLQ